jgi:membrane protein YqaA with SNARE-associated domain
MEGMGGSVIAILIGVWGTFALDVFSTLNSSPQTTELFANDREETLMHWVLIGSGVAVGGGAVASFVSKKPWPFMATVIVAAGMYFAYAHAVKRGQGTEPPSNSDR